MIPEKGYLLDVGGYFHGFVCGQLSRFSPDELIRFASAILKTIARISGCVEQPPDMGVFQQRYVKRHGIITTDTIPFTREA